jgi:hypothetical protein
VTVAAPDTENPIIASAKQIFPANAVLWLKDGIVLSDGREYRWDLKGHFWALVFNPMIAGGGSWRVPVEIRSEADVPGALEVWQERARTAGGAVVGQL